MSGPFGVLTRLSWMCANGIAPIQRNASSNDILFFYGYVSAIPNLGLRALRSLGSYLNIDQVRERH